MTNYNTIIELYYYHFLKDIYFLYHTLNMQVEELNLLDHQFLNCSGKSYFESFSTDLFLNEYETDKTILGKNILANGMFFPFYLLKDDNEYKKLFLGKHRLYSLLCLPNQIKNKKFLFLKFPYSSSYELMHNRVFLKNNGEITKLLKDKDGIFKIKKISVQEDSVALHHFLKLCDALPRALSLYQDEIPVNPIFNDIELFNDFIIKPLDEKKLWEDMEKLKK